MIWSGRALFGIVLLAAAGLPAAGEPEQKGPNSKQVLRALLRSHDVPLAVHESCASTGSEFKDRTLGDYVAGLLADQAETSDKGRNSVTTSCRPGKTQGRWHCTVEFGRRDGENEWVRGVEFLLTSSGLVLRSTIRCTGGG